MLLNINVTRVGSEEQYGPRKAGEILKDLFPNTEPCITFKLLTRQPRRIDIGAILHGILTRDSEDHYTFLEDTTKIKTSSAQRNPHVYRGQFINVNQGNDGMLYPTFNRPRYTSHFSFQDLCREAAAELLIVASLVVKKGSTK